MRLRTLLRKAEETRGITVETRKTHEGDGNILFDTYETMIVDYRNQDGKVGATPKIGVSIQHSKEDSQFVEAVRIDIDPHLALSIRTVKAVAKIFNLS